MSARRRIIAIACAVAVGACWQGVAGAQAPTAPLVPVSSTANTAQRGGPGYVHDLRGGVETGTTAPAGRRAPPKASAPVFWARLPDPSRDADGNPCVRIVRRAYPTAGAAAIAEDIALILWPLAVRDYPLCPDVDLPDSTPATSAAFYWQVTGEDLLPRPTPRIAPGYMLAGKMAYLEANTQPTVHFEHPTPLGLLTIDAASKLFVDWGDGMLSGPYAGPGGPWPDGDITHFWTHARAYDIRVEQRWTATWRLAGQGGTLAGLTTEGLLPGFEVRQLQAVLNR